LQQVQPVRPYDDPRQDHPDDAGYAQFPQQQRHQENDQQDQRKYEDGALEGKLERNV
jgi:hypothetical protein